MALPAFTMRQLLEAGVHFGHSTRRWNPKMAPYLFGSRNNIHIIDLQQTAPLMHRAMTTVRDIVGGGGRMLFVGTKRQASDKIMDSAKRCGQYYVNHRWLGGMMTNWQTISKSIKRLRELDEQFEGENIGLTKKELLKLTRERDKLDRALGGIKEMGGLPDVLFVIDINKEAIAVAEANKLGIPVVGVIDSNSDPRGIDYPIPGNDDAIRAISLYCDLMVGAVLDGIQQEVALSTKDPGAAEAPPVEKMLQEGAQVKEKKKEKEKPGAPAEETGKSSKAEMKKNEAKPEAKADKGEKAVKEEKKDAPAEAKADKGEKAVKEEKKAAPAEAKDKAGDKPAEEKSGDKS